MSLKSILASSEFSAASHRTRSEKSIFGGFLQKISYQSKWVPSNQEASINWFIHLLFFCIRRRRKENIKASIQFGTC
jgi:hypothetical protein